MTADDHARVRALFDEAFELPREERDAFLERKCGLDVNLLSRLRAMLSSAESSDFLGAPTGGAVPNVSPANAGSEEPGTKIGVYTLIESIGEGGFGSVWRAEQHEPVRRHVALKILKLGMDTLEVMARFEQERQALALMDHPNISRVFDAGATDAGRPYFVMELVVGEPILDYCEARGLNNRARLEIFTDVCRAIQHAHQKGIIHRDIKPSNVLVCEQDGQAVPKVIDFGIAKAIDVELTAKTLLTEQGQMIGTPAYMSPEQADMRLGDVDTRSDVYGLGALLYELLTGTTPFDVRTLLDRGYEELLRTIREVDPHKPSTRVLFLEARPEAGKDSKRTDLKRLGSTLRGDLDWIVMRCLEKDRARRYDTASGLALDIERYLRGDTVLAAPPSARYRFKKALRRHRVAAVSAGLVGLALIIGLAGTIWQARIAADERDEARRESDRADARADELEKVATFQAEMLAGLDSTDVGVRLWRDIRERYSNALEGGDLSNDARRRSELAFAEELARVSATDVAVGLVVNSFVTPAVKATATQFEDQPLVDASLRSTLSTIYSGLGQFSQSKDLRAWVLETRVRILGEDHPKTLEAYNFLGDVLFQLGEYDEAEAMLQKSYDGRHALLGPDDPATLESLGNLGDCYRYRGEYEKAAPLLERALEGMRRIHGDEARATLIQSQPKRFVGSGPGARARCRTTVA